jgi:hypothetical protein
MTFYHWIFQLYLKARLLMIIFFEPSRYTWSAPTASAIVAVRGLGWRCIAPWRNELATLPGNASIWAGTASPRHWSPIPIAPAMAG